MLIVDVEMHVADVGAVGSEQGSHLRVFQGLVERKVDVVIFSACTVGVDAIRRLLVLLAQVIDVLCDGHEGSSLLLGPNGDGRDGSEDTISTCTSKFACLFLDGSIRSCVR